MASFNNLGLKSWLLKLCEKISYRVPTPIQSLTIQPILKGQSIIANAETGSGKTAAFAFPLLQRLSQDPYGVFCIVIAPSRELAIQINEQLEVFGQSMNLRQALLIGGVGFDRQHNQLNDIPHFVVGTPGRIAHMLEKSEKFAQYAKNCGVVVLDEADRLFEDTLLVKMKEIIAQLPQLKQIVLATATVDNNFQAKRLKELLNRPDINFEKFSTYDKVKTVPTLIQKYILVPDSIKTGYLLAALQQRANTKIIIFVKTCKQCHLIHSALKRLELKSCMLHSFMKQTRRGANLSLFRSGKADILVTTDLASRGLDIKCVDTVICFEIPRKVSDYIHRVGRTARQNRQGEAITFVTQYEVQLFLGIEKEVGVKMQEEKIDEAEAVIQFRVFSKALREAKLELSNKGVLEMLENRAQKKKTMRNEVRRVKVPEEEDD